MNSQDILEKFKELQKKYYIAIDDAYNAKTVLGEDIFIEMRQDFVDRYRIERDQLKKVAEIADKNLNFELDLKIYELTPHRCGFLWLCKNEARKLKEREIGVENRIELDGRTYNVEMLEEKIYSNPDPADEKPRHWWERLFKRKDMSTTAANVQSIAEQQEPVAMENGSTLKAATGAPPSATSDSAHGASDAALQSDKKTATVTEPPTTPTAKAPKLKHKPKKVTESTAEPNKTPPAPTAHAPQLSGQIAMDELANN